MLKDLFLNYGDAEFDSLGLKELNFLRDGLKAVEREEVNSAEDGRKFIELVRMLRQSIAEADKLHGDNYPQLLESLLSVGEDGLYNDSLRFIFELIQNVDDCEYPDETDCSLDVHFDFNADTIELSYNEVGFSPFNVFAITGIAEKAKNISDKKKEIGEKGIGFKSVFGVAEKVRIRSGYFAFELLKNNFTIPGPCYDDFEFCNGTEMTLFVRQGKSREIYNKIRDKYCNHDALFSSNPILFLNKLTKLRMYFDSNRSMEFCVDRNPILGEINRISKETNVRIAMKLSDYKDGMDRHEEQEITCTKYSFPYCYSRQACLSRYGDDTSLGENGGRELILQVAFPDPEYVELVGNGSLYSFLPTQLHLMVPVVCHVPFKLDASREFVDPQDKNKWFTESVEALISLMDYAYEDYCKDVKQNIVNYLPGERYSLFADNGNDKEKCLNSIREFRGDHYKSLPIFLSSKGNYCKANEVFIFNPDEQIFEQEKVAELLGITKGLFIPPTHSQVRKLFLETRKEVGEALFEKALAFPDKVAAIVEYLSRYMIENTSFRLKSSMMPESTFLNLQQIEAFWKDVSFRNFFVEISNTCLKEGKRITLFLDKSSNFCNISEVMYAGFECAEAPKKVERYLINSKGNVVLADIDEDQYFACGNGLVLSSHNSISSFASFCGAIDSHDIFAVRMKLRDASEKLDAYDLNNEISDEEYLHRLKSIRYVVKDSLGKQGYKSYLDLILKSGIDSKRFIQELLQNADDCVYPEGVIPRFTFRTEKRKMIAEYNECGFTRSNVRSITAIGESTKNKLLSGETQSIGEKGVGFKTVFAVASEVSIYSGDFNFKLTDQEPTIPKTIDNGGNRVSGTRLVLELKEKQEVPTYTVKSVLELCLCLRQLKSLVIDNHEISIDDTDDKRNITIDGKQQYVFDKVVHEFAVTDEDAFEERINEIQSVSRKQRITCYIPRGSAEAYEWNLYSGLPTKHKIKIPLAIDAPFALTTSREEIDVGSEKWNTLIRNEMYQALLLTIEAFKREERIDILKFCRFLPRYMGNKRIYVNDLFDFDFLKGYDFLSMLKNTEILPTYEEGVFAIPSKQSAKRYPLFMKQLFDVGKFGNTSQSSIIEEKVKDVSKDKAKDKTKESEYEAALNALECNHASEAYVFSILNKYLETDLGDAAFRTNVYDYLYESDTDFSNELKKINIIPVYDKKDGGTIFIAWKDGKIFVKKETRKSTESYFILNESILPKSICEGILDVNINEMNDEWERNNYNCNLRLILEDNSKSDEEKWEYLLDECGSGRLEKFKSRPVLLEFAQDERLPLRNQMGDIVCSPLFICEEKEEYFPVDVIKMVTVSSEGKKLAGIIGTGSLGEAYYADFHYDEQLTADDIESFQDDYFINQDEILRGFYLDGKISDELIAEYQLEYLTLSGSNDIDENYEFPSVPVKDHDQLVKHMLSVLQKPIKIVSQKVERLVKKGKNSKGELFDLDYYDSREGAISTYMPIGTTGKCFCQMCRRVKSIQFIEVNNLEKEPDYYYPQMRVALCLECSKMFEAVRNNEKLRKKYFEEIRSISVGNQGTVEVKINSQQTLTFTGTHLAEIQTILDQQN